MMESKAVIEDRRKYVKAFSDTMLKIWQERMAILRVIDTGNLYRSVASGVSIEDNEISRVTFTFNFSEYGIYVNAGTGRETPRGNPGDIGRAKVRKPKKWYRPKFYMSMMNLREFFAESFHIKFVSIIDETFTTRSNL